MNSSRARSSLIEFFLLKCMPSALLCFVISTHALAGGDFSYEDLVNLIQQKNISSIESLLPFLPANFRSNYTLIHTSRSLQGASYLNPRVVLFGKDAKLTCTFNGDATQSGFDTLECFQFRIAQRDFDFRQIQFPTQKNQLNSVVFSKSGFTADGKVSCSSCHEPDPRPNWDGYHHWPGFYGENDDILDETEKANYPSFVSSRKNHLRYKWLLQDETDPSAPYTIPKSRPNFSFSSYVGRMNGYRVARILENAVPQWQSLGFAVSALNCLLTKDQLDQISNAHLSSPESVDLGDIFKKVGVSRGFWTTQIFNDPDTSFFNSGGEFHTGASLFSEVVGAAIISDYALHGYSEFQKDLENVAEYNITHYTEFPSLDIAAIEGILPAPYLLDNSVNHYLCPDLDSLFVKVYIDSTNLLHSKLSL